MIEIPLLKDNHNHLFVYSALNQAINIFDISEKKEVINIIKTFNDNKINVITGWLDNYYSFQDAELNNFAPLIIVHNSLHKYIFNLSAAKIIAEKYPEWVENNNNQIWVEKNIMQILSYISSLKAFDKAELDNTIAKNKENGFYFTSDMFVDNDDVFDFLNNNHEYMQITEIWTSPEKFKTLPEHHKKICKGVKIFTDGALGASSAAISEYKGHWNSVLSYSQNELTQKLEEISELKTEIAIHCIGDIAIEQVINSLKIVQKRNPIPKIRLEHCQFITEKQAKNAKDLSLILSMQPNFSMDSEIYSDRLTKNYCIKNNPFRMLIDNIGFVCGKDLIFGTDGMPTSAEIALKMSLFPPVSGQKLKIEEFIAGYSD